MNDRDELIRAHFPLVRKIARRIRRLVPGCEFDDLIGDGSIGLIRAVDSFDPARGPTLEAYAGRIIAGAMLNGLRRLDPVSERVRREMREADRQRYAIAVESGVMPTQVEMESRRPALRRAAIHAYRHAPLSLDSPLPQEERLSGDWSADPARLASSKLEQEGVRNALNALPQRHRRVLKLYYFAERSLHEIGRELEVSPQRASQLHLAALKRLRKVLHASIPA